MRSLLLVAPLVLAGCAATGDVVPVGPNRYQIEADAMDARGGIDGAQRMATKKAETTCAERGLYVNVLSVETRKGFPSAGIATLTFECGPKQPESAAAPPPKQPATTAAPPSEDKYKQLAELKQLLDSGALTQEEFNTEKAKILAKP
jgi:hypothetical protein